VGLLQRTALSCLITGLSHTMARSLHTSTIGTVLQLLLLDLWFSSVLSSPPLQALLQI